MKSKFRGLTMTALLLSASNMTFADQGSLSAVGDLPGYGEEAYFAADASDIPSQDVQPVNHLDSYVGDDYVSDTAPQPYAAQPAAASAPRYAPIGVADLQQVGHRIGSGQVVSRLRRSSCDSYCDGGCDGGCDSRCGSTRRIGRGRIGSMLDRVDSSYWGSTEFLMWFTQNRDMPALITTAPAGQQPVLGLANTSVAFGADINGELSGGYRSDFGRFLSDNVGFGGRFWTLADNNDSYYRASDGSDVSIGRPFFNTDTGGEDSLLVALDGTFTGAIAAESELQIEGYEAYSRLRFGCAKNCQLDFLGGYSHFEVDDSLRISSTTVTNATARTRTYNDLFDIENRFNGGQLGFEMVMTRGRWMARSLTKVHLGNMEQSVRLQGNAVDQTPPNPANNTNGGLYTLDNTGTFERDTFAFIPEANFKLAYKVRQNLLLSVGYSFIYFDNVALVGDVLDRAVDGTALNTNNAIARPAFNFDDSSLWVQGLDLGVVFDF